MAITRVQVVQVNSGTSSVASLNVTGITSTTAGNLLVMFVNNKPTTSADTASLPAGWQKGPEQGGGSGSYSVIFYYPNNPGSITSVLVTAVTDNQIIDATFCEYSGIRTTSPLIDSGNAPSTTNTYAVSTTGSAAGANDLVVACIAADQTGGSGQTLSTATGWTKIGTDVIANSASNASVQEETRPQTGGTQTWTITLGFAVSSSRGCIAVFANAASGSIFRAANLDGLGSGGQFFDNPLGK